MSVRIADVIIAGNTANDVIAEFTAQQTIITNFDRPLQTNRRYRLTYDGTIPFELPTPPTILKDNTILVYVKFTVLPTAGSWGTNYFVDGLIPAIDVNSNYQIIYMYDANIPAWVAGVIEEKVKTT